MDVTRKPSYELTTSFSIPLVAAEGIARFAESFEVALRETVSAHPTIRAYFVAVDADAREVAIGLRFEGMDPRFIEETATEVLEESIEAAATAGSDSPAVVREESSLVPA